MDDLKPQIRDVYGLTCKSSYETNREYEREVENELNNQNFLSVTHNMRRKSSTGDSAVDLKFCENERLSSSQNSQQLVTEDSCFKCFDSNLAENTLFVNAKQGKDSDDTKSETEKCDAEEDFIGHKSSTMGCSSLLSTDSSSRGCMFETLQKNTSTWNNEQNDYTGRRRLRRSWSTNSWRKIKNIVTWAPFMQQYKKQKYPWIQLAGHENNFHSGDQGSVLKRYSDCENYCFQALMTDILRPYVPEYRGVLERCGEKYISMQDLLVDMNCPSLMDCKIGIRTYLEEELGDAKRHTFRKDLYDKMIRVDPDAPTQEEHLRQAISKSRYMKWRETISSTSTLGFRIEGVKKWIGTSSRNFKKTKSRNDVKNCLRDFTDSNVTVLRKYVKHLYAIRGTLEVSPFFRTHELIGSSLLFAHDKSTCTRVWMIDFGKTSPLPPSVSISHQSPWIEGNHEDGYLIGLQNLIDIMNELYFECNRESDI